MSRRACLDVFITCCVVAVAVLIFVSLANSGMEP